MWRFRIDPFRCTGELVKRTPETADYYRGNPRIRVNPRPYIDYLLLTMIYVRQTPPPSQDYKVVFSRNRSSPLLRPMASSPYSRPYQRHSDPLSTQQQQSYMSYPSDQEPTTAKPSDSTQKPESKPQATFLTKLYACVSNSFISSINFLSGTSLLERPENHHMIRWDPAGEHIIVERPEQLALHLLPSIYRQSRFASFSRQLNVRASIHSAIIFSYNILTDLWLHAQGQPS